MSNQSQSSRALPDAVDLTSLPSIFISHSSKDNALVLRWWTDYGQNWAVWMPSGTTPMARPLTPSAGKAAFDQQATGSWRYSASCGSGLLRRVPLPAALASDWVQDEILLAWKQKNERGRISPRSSFRSWYPKPLISRVPEPLDLVQYISFVERPGWTEEQAFAQLLVAVHSKYTQLRPGEA